jgi:murein DD-endopeptidase MepM/ murein hydrolase activator NlpD
VVHAGDLGIYGNCVVVDHGYALQSIYGHLNRVDVKVGDMVKKDQSLGVAGATGMALGVHVHFSMQIDGVQVNPREWWDEHWIHDRIMSKLDPNAKTQSPEKTESGASPPRKLEVTSRAAAKKKHRR